MALIDKTQFDKLWALNPVFTDTAHDYDNTRILVSNLLEAGYMTTDGAPLTFDLLFTRYGKYIRVRKIHNEGVDPRYRKKIYQVEPLHQWLYKGLYNIVETVGETSRHHYFWGTLTENQLPVEFEKFRALCRR